MARKGISWFDMTSRRERERRERKYYEKMFPLGEAQRQRELEILAGAVPEGKPEELLYQLLCVKECLQEEDSEERADALREWEASPLAQRAGAWARAVTAALARLEAQAGLTQSLSPAEAENAGARIEDILPTVEQVKEAARSGHSVR